MIRFVILVLIMVATAIGSYLLLKLPGGVEFDLFGWQGKLNVLGLVLALIALGTLIAALLWLTISVFRLPSLFGRSRKTAKIKKANMALTDGLLAAEAGDVEVAYRLAKKAAAYAEDDRLKALLEARAAESAGDWVGAERAWAQLARLPGGQLAGLRGTATAAMERGDSAAAEQSARAALELKSGADWPFNSLFDLQVARGEWPIALETLSIGEKRNLIGGDSLRRRRAVLKTAYAASLPNGSRSDAQRALAEAIRAAPGFPPAAWHGARHLLLDKKDKAALGVLELGWKARPHPALAQMVRQMSVGADKDILKERLQRLLEANPDHYESKVLSAELAMQKKDWVSAVKTLALLVEAGPTGRLCLLMERALKGYGDPKEAARWARMAVTASREADWSDLEPKGGAFSYAAADWGRLVYQFGDAGQLVHPRHETFARELDVARASAALPSPDEEGETARPNVKLPPGDMGAPLDFVPED